MWADSKKREIGINNMIGKTYGNLTVVERIKIDKYAKVVCICKCGKKVIARASFLERGETRTCDATCRYSPKRRGFGLVTGAKFVRVRNGAKERNLECSVTPEDLWNQWLKQKGTDEGESGECVCPKTGKIIHLGLHLPNGGNASLDRINPKIGYTKNNIQWVHPHYNFCKQQHDEIYFDTDFCVSVVLNSSLIDRKKVIEQLRAKGFADES